MSSYLDLLTKLKENIENDIFPEAEKAIAIEHVNQLFTILWKYSD